MFSYLINYVNGKISRFIIEINKKIKRKRLINKDFSLISSNCNGCIISSDLGCRYNSPFVNLWIKPKDYIRLLKKLEFYMGLELSFIKEEGIDYPVAKLEDIVIYFQHYTSEEEAYSKWNERRKRINYDNLFILFSDRDGCTNEDLLEFDKLQYRKKIVFTNKMYPEIESSYYIKGFENQDSVGICSEYVGRIYKRRHLEQFDYVEWLNS